MDDFSEDRIWDTIKDSAKDKIDYATFAALFPFKADNFVSSMIYGLALGTPKEAIARKIAVQVNMTRNFVDEPAVIDSIRDNEPLLIDEVAATRIALKMLNNGDELQTVYDAVIDYLKSTQQRSGS